MPPGVVRMQTRSCGCTNMGADLSSEAQELCFCRRPPEHSCCAPQVPLLCPGSPRLPDNRQRHGHVSEGADPRSGKMPAPAGTDYSTQGCFQTELSAAGAGGVQACCTHSLPVSNALPCWSWAVPRGCSCPSAPRVDVTSAVQLPAPEPAGKRPVLPVQQYHCGRQLHRRRRHCQVPSAYLDQPQ